MEDQTGGSKQMSAIEPPIVMGRQVRIKGVLGKLRYVKHGITPFIPLSSDQTKYDETLWQGSEKWLKMWMFIFQMSC